METSAQAPLTLRWSGWTDIGRVRKNNEDSFIGLRFDARESELLGRIGDASLGSMDFAFAVCDGMGGAMAGEFASKIAVEKIASLLPRAFHQAAAGLDAGFADVLGEVFTQIHKALVYVGESYDECRGMATTLTLCWITPSWLYFAHVGDSRLYYLSKCDGGIKQLTHDDTHVGWLFRNGHINEYQARTHPRRNVLQKALGGGNQYVEPQVGAVGIEPGDAFVLCSDGLTDGLYDSAMLEIARAKEGQGSETIARRLVDSSVKNSGRDNTTAVVIEIENPPSPKRPAGARTASKKAG